MKESTQTLLFILAAVVSVLAASWSRPTDVTYRVDDLIGKPLFAPFEPEEATSMRIVRFDEETATLREFEVAEEKGVWSIPSKGGYPADAERQMAEASTGVVGLDILSIASQDASDHAEYGVVEPSPSLEVGQTGVGTRVTLESTGGDKLVDLVIGKAVKGADAQRYVRKPSQDVVYTAAIDPSKFSTKFEDWIEDDLLKINTWDIARVDIKDYTAELVMQGMRPALALDPRAELTVDYNDADSKWTPRDLKEYDRDAEAYKSFELGDDEELNEATLTDLKNAVGELKIVDVERKPTGLSGDLKAGEDLFKDKDSIQSLMLRGFAPVGSASGGTEVMSSEGEVILTQKDGVEYVLRFGKLQLADDEGDAEAAGEGAAEGEEAGAKKATGVNRYLFVMARYNDTMIPAPELEEVPAEEEAAKEATDEAAEDAAEPAEGEEAADDAPEEATEEATAEADKAKAETEAKRDEIIKANQRKEDEYNAKVAAAKARVAELNDRFGDWYYVISDEVYKKVAIGRDELVKTKDPAEGKGVEGEEAEGAKAAAPAGVPGLPNLPGIQSDPAAAPATEEEPAAEEEPASEGAATEEEAPMDEPAEEATEQSATPAEQP
jgi:hypothetical protein